LTKVRAIETSPLVRTRHPALAEAADVLGTPPIRNLATIGGNIGRASPASDLGPPLIVHGAVATIVGRRGSREELVENLYAGPGLTSLGPDDIISSVFVPSSDPGFGSAHLKIGPRGSGTDIAVVGVSAGVTLGDDGAISTAGIVLASVAPIPMRARAAERALLGNAPSADVLAAAGEAAAAECRPIDDVRASASYRKAVTGVLTRRALSAAIAATGKAA
jgi:carbon-monoxide dehydrogenase medium subunit